MWSTCYTTLQMRHSKGSWETSPSHVVLVILSGCKTLQNHTSVCRQLSLLNKEEVLKIIFTRHTHSLLRSVLPLLWQLHSPRGGALHLTPPPLSSKHVHTLSFHLALLPSFTFLHSSVYQQHFIPLLCFCLCFRSCCSDNELEVRSC